MTDMNFKEWLEREEQNESFRGDLGRIANAAISGIGRAPIQVARGLGNALVRAPWQFVRGDGVRKAGGTFLKGVGQTLSGASGLSSLARGAQVFQQGGEGDKSFLSAGGSTLGRQILGIADPAPKKPTLTPIDHKGRRLPIDRITGKPIPPVPPKLKPISSPEDDFDTQPLDTILPPSIMGKTPAKKVRLRSKASDESDPIFSNQPKTSAYIDTGSTDEFPPKKSPFEID
jgi:hypothetical protein